MTTASFFKEGFPGVKSMKAIILSTFKVAVKKRINIFHIHS
jgi:hypothetical protein